jgi:hypothetical protein
MKIIDDNFYKNVNITIKKVKLKSMFEYLFDNFQQETTDKMVTFSREPSNTSIITP